MKLDKIKKLKKMAKRSLTAKEAEMKERFVNEVASRNLLLAKESSIPVEKMVRPLRGGDYQKLWTMWLKNPNGGRLLGLMTKNGLKTIDNPENYQIIGIK